MRAAEHYLGRYGSTSANLARVLARKAKKRLLGTEPPPDLAAWIDEVVATAVRGGLVDDRVFAESVTASLRRKGISARNSRATLRHKGVPEDLADAALASDAPDERALARRHAERKRLGPFRRVPDPARRDKDVAALARAGFPFRIAAAIIDGTEE